MDTSPGQKYGDGNAGNGNGLERDSGAERTGDSGAGWRSLESLSHPFHPYRPRPSEYLSLGDIDPALADEKSGEGREEEREAGRRELKRARERETGSEDVEERGGEPDGLEEEGEDSGGGIDGERQPKWKTDNKTCDNCRKRKIKCANSQGGPNERNQVCEGCRKLKIECTYEYVKKKPGRKNGFVLMFRRDDEHRKRRSSTPKRRSPKPSSTPSRSSMSNPGPSRPSNGGRSSVGSADMAQFPYPPAYSRQPSTPVAQAPLASRSVPVPAPPASAPPVQPVQAAIQPLQPEPTFGYTRPNSSFTFSPRTRNNDGSLDWLDSMFEGSAMGSLWPGDAADLFTSDQATLLALESPENAPTISTAASGVGPSLPTSLAHQAGMLATSHRREPQLEDVTSWANISHYISLFLQYLYPLLPLVHRPTFAEHLATRRDLRDTDFRALLLSIVAYVISQLPTSRLVTDGFDIEGLKRLQRRCHRTCKALQRTYYGPTNLTQITTIIFDTFYLLSIGLGHTAASRLGQAVQLAFSMGIHSDEKTQALGLDAVEVQLRRRVFWQLYVSDKTRAIPGPPMLVNDFQGVCSLPDPIDDDFITSQGMFPQPPSRTSVLCGFVIVSQVFRILSECFFHHRCITTGLRTISTEWTIDAEDRLHRILQDMPLAIQEPATHSNGALVPVFAMQRANILITAAIAKFALYDLRAALNVDTDQLAKEREAIAREIHLLLMNIPVEDLASNGESVRGKVFHIACALCAQNNRDERGQELIRDWCNMFSAISFVQMPLPPPDVALDSRANSPPESGREY